MTVIRTTGARRGIEDYLEKGNKAGREFGRNELDERVPISGDIDTLRAVNKLNKADRVTYTHITMAPKEDMLDVSTFKEMLREYVRHIFSAFREDEYYLYAEIHFPKIKSYISETGEKIIRFPHLHIVVPNLNLLTGQSVNPWGVYEHNLKYLNAIQENANIKIGTISPSQCRRSEFTAESSMKERVRGDIFLNNAKELKSHLLEEILEKNISSIEQFRDLLRNLGECKTRNLAKINQYEAVRLNGAAEFVNLRHYVFSQSFLSLSREDKILALQPEDNTEYTQLGTPGNIPVSINELLTEWHEIKSKEIKYLPGGTNRHFKLMNYHEKKNFLERRAEQFYKKIGAVADATIIPVLHVTRPVVRMMRPELRVNSPSKRTGRRFDNPASQAIRDCREEITSSELAYSKSLIPSLNRAVDLEFLLQELVHDVGLVRSKYQIAGDERTDAPPILSGKIRCGTRHLNAIDFLRVEMRMPFLDAFRKLKQVVKKQNNYIPNLDPGKLFPDPNLWRRFSMSKRVIRKQLYVQYKVETEQAREAVAAEKTELAQGHSIQKFRLYQTKMPAVVRKLFLADLDRDYTMRKEEIATTFAEEKRSIRKKRVGLNNWDFYLIFLRTNALSDRACLNELQKHSPSRKKLSGTYSISGAEKASFVSDAVMRHFKLNCAISPNGDVVYTKDGEEIVHDEGDKINVLFDNFATKVGAALSREKWVGELKLQGSDKATENFVQKAMVEVGASKFNTVGNNKLIGAADRDIRALGMKSSPTESL